MLLQTLKAAIPFSVILPTSGERRSDAFVKSGEGRFIDEAGYMPMMQETISELMKNYSLTPGDFSRIVFSASDSKQHADLPKSSVSTSIAGPGPFLCADR